MLLALLGSVLSQAQTSGRAQQDYDRRGYQYFGAIVGNASDIDGDGTPDFVVGDAGPPCHELPPALWILSGKDGSTLRFIPLPDPPSGPIAYPDIELAGGADLDGDQVPDLVVGERGRAPGVVLAVSGKTGSVLRMREVDCSGWCSTGWIRLVSDRDSDGVPEIGVLCPRTNQSECKLFSGRTGEPLAEFAFKNETHSPIASFIELPSMTASSPGALAFLVDPVDDESHPTGGASPRRPPSHLRVVNREGQGEPWHRDLSSDSFATNAALALVGDTDEDGTADLLVAYGDSVDLVSGRTGVTRFHYATMDTGLGCSLAAPGDLDHDGVPDFVLGEYDPGLFEGAVIAYSGKTGAGIWSVHGNFEEDNVHHLGYRMAVLGDLDGDGANDLVVGTLEGPDGVARGVALVLSGRTGQRLFQFRRQLDKVVVEFGPAREILKR